MHDENFKLFEICLIKWRISDNTLANTQFFLQLQTKVFNKTAILLRIGVVQKYLNETLFDIADDVPQNT